MNGFAAVSRNEAPLPTVNNATRNGRYCPLTAAGTNCALGGDSSNDFLNCCTRMSVRLFDIPHRKNSTVTRENSTICPTGNTARFVSPCDLVPALIDVETCMHHPLKFHFHW